MNGQTTLTVEIERKWRLDKLPPESRLGRAMDIQQGYLPSGEGEIRIRRMLLGNRFAIHYLTAKEETDSILSRAEWEVEIPDWVFNILWPLTENRRIEKTRHALRYEYVGRPRNMSLDRYRDNLAGLTILECEFASDADAARFFVPEWVGPFIEVTQDPRYRNRELALQGLPSKRRE